ncbi:hypothetical protein C8P63_12816 [Melghirimyces profundicolus]|uniref:Uncharacterized protein n=1 Tax=Melghirimyces profundicolus TaxID=1242148 RepID=A0A2T6BC54_9BACL|nr:hypothetical protein [Melghirimyces profundicolus]PTX53655.1 hypothetical protein C8P63_12816 [Melghirimyces profundicolus]
MIHLPKIPPRKSKIVVNRGRNEEESRFVAKLKFEDRELHFEMCLTAEEADVYQNARTSYEKVKAIHSDREVLRHWNEQKFISLHEHFGEQIRRYCGLAKYDPRAKKKAEEYCELQIQFAPVAKRSFKNDPFSKGLPEHTGYRCLIELMLEDGRFGEALYLARLAREEGWKGPWKEIVERIRRVESIDPGSRGERF